MVDIVFDFDKNREFIKLMIIKELKKVIKGAVLVELNGGRSPVKGKGRFPKYAKSYRDVIKKGEGDYSGKKRSPVNLRVTGELHVSIFVKETRDGIEVGFDHYLADVHNRLGVKTKTGKVKRRMLPTNEGEVFNSNIQEVIDEAISKGVAKAINIINR